MTESRKLEEDSSMRWWRACFDKVRGVEEPREAAK